MYFDSPAWHPDGIWIAADHADSIDTSGDGNPDEMFSGIWLVHSTDGHSHPLIWNARHPSWNPDGTMLAFAAGSHIYTAAIASFDPPTIDTTTIKKVSYAGTSYFPSWSPNGQWIAYQQVESGIMLVNPSGDRYARIPGGDGYPIWNTWKHSDNSILLFRSFTNDGRVAGDSVWSIDTTFTRKLVKVLTGSHAENQYPRYSPNDSLIAFCSKSPAGAPAIWSMQEMQSATTKISLEFAWRFDWSPDGSKLVYLFWDPVNPHPGNGELWIVNSDGSGASQLTHTTDTSSLRREGNAMAHEK